MTITSRETKEKIFSKFTRVDKIGGKDYTLLSPFVVSKQKKILFFHIAKTGGSSIDHLLKKNAINDNILNNVNVNFETRKKYFREVVEEWDEYYKFTFIRNKYDLLVSSYHYDRVASLAGCSFEDFLKNHVNGESCWYPKYDFWIDQHFLTTIDDKPIFDFIGNFSNYSRDLASVCSQIKIPREEIKKNIGRYDKKKEYNSYYTAELKFIVDNKFAKEIKYFKWNNL
tara:strand:+ start:4639 stop:5319 length:681 start_codon:yes stop_codon:yes gene_type:complete